MSNFATLEQVLALSGATYTAAEQQRIETLLPFVSDLIRNEGKKVGIDVDRKITADTSYKSVVTLVTVDVIVRTMRQSTTGDPMSQESQSGLGYSWSGSYAIPGGGIAMSLMNNELKRLGFKTQIMQGVKLWPIGCSGTESQ